MTSAGALARVAAIFAHPDDEVLGCGGALSLHARRGDEVRILILATGLTSRGKTSTAAIRALRREAEEACAILGGRSVELRDFPDNAMDSIPLLKVVARVEAFLADFPATRIYTHHGGDLNVDHRVTHQAVATAARPLPGVPDRVVLACEVPSSTEWAPATLPPFIPTEFLDLEDALTAKVAAMRAYRGELRKWPHPRSAQGIEALARWRGGQCGREAAEAFVTVRRVGRIGEP